MRFKVKTWRDSTSKTYIKYSVESGGILVWDEKGNAKPYARCDVKKNTIHGVCLNDDSEIDVKLIDYGKTWTLRNGDDLVPDLDDE